VIATAGVAMASAAMATAMGMRHLRMSGPSSRGEQRRRRYAVRRALTTR
jgi:hypothetical protein